MSEMELIKKRNTLVDLASKIIAGYERLGNEKLARAWWAVYHAEYESTLAEIRGGKSAFDYAAEEAAAHAVAAVPSKNKSLSPAQRNEIRILKKKLKDAEKRFVYAEELMVHFERTGELAKEKHWADKVSREWDLMDEIKVQIQKIKK